MKKVFIDGSAGTTGLRIYDRLTGRKDITLITLKESERKDDNFRKAALNESDIAFLCLPDEEARRAVVMTENNNTVLIDTSTAHRTFEDWAYGFPELSKELYAKIENSKRIAVPGCHASGFIALVYPLIEKGIINKDILLTCHSVTGYSGGGKKMITEYEGEGRDFLLGAPRQYGITQNHKHLKEMVKISGIENTPIFCPIVSDFYSGMAVTVPLFKKDIQGSFDDIKKVYSEKYNTNTVYYKEDISKGGFISALGMSKKDSMEISVCGNEDRILLTALYDNLGKGSSGAAIQCLNIVMGAEMTEGLEL